MASRNVYLISRKRMNHVVSHISGVKKAVLGTAREIGAIAQSRLAPHRKTGAAHIEVSQADVDAFASLVDKNALSIEFGHFHGPRSRGLDRKYVEGLHLFIDWYHD